MPMTVAQARAIWRRQLHAYGEDVTLRRANPATTATVKARIVGFSPEELVAGIDQGERKIYLLAEDVEASGFPVPFKTGGGDSIEARGTRMNISDVDDNTHRIAGVLVAYQIRAIG